MSENKPVDLAAPSTAKAAANLNPVSPPVAPPPPAPFVYLDYATVYGFCDGIVSVTVEAVRHTLVDGVKTHDLAVVGHLRMSLAASRSLRSALEAAELMALPPAGASH